jgi:hypothetical protein
LKLDLYLGANQHSVDHLDSWAQQLVPGLCMERNLQAECQHWLGYRHLVVMLEILVVLG